MAKRGRKRRAGVERTPSGAISRARHVVEVEHHQLVAVRMRHHGLSEEAARDQKAATVVGRWALTTMPGSSRKMISDLEYQAAVRWLELYAEFKKAVMSPDREREGSAVRADGSDSVDYEDWAKAVCTAWRNCEKAIERAQCSVEGRQGTLFAALDFVVLRDLELIHMLDDVRMVLRALSSHFGLTAGADSPASA